jgi:integrase
MRKTLTDTGVAALKPRAGRYAFPDPQLAGHYVRVTPNGAKSFCAVARDPNGKQIWATIGPTDRSTIEQARSSARAAMKRIAAGLPAFETPTKAETFGMVSEQWLDRHVVARGLRSEREIRRILTVYVLPRWKDRPFRAIRRLDVAELLDQVQDENGGRQADAVLSVARSIGNWYATRADDYVAPFVKGMRRTSPAAQTRERVLDDDELRAVWRATESSGAFGVMVRLALLTAQRREKLASVKWSDIDDSGVWTIAGEDREKGNAIELQLPQLALDAIATLPSYKSNPHLFASARGVGCMSGFSKMKKALDGKVEAIKPGVPTWTLHDLRRTARSLMSRCGVSSEVAERVLGHAAIGVKGVYDRHSYASEKTDALQRLAALLESIINPRSDTVVPMRKPRARR